MDLSKIKTLIDFVGQSNITELAVTEKDTTVRIFRTRRSGKGATPADSFDASAFANATSAVPPTASPAETATPVRAPLYGVLHTAPAPGETAFVVPGDTVEAGQTLFIVEAMKVFNTVRAPRAGRIVRIAATDGGEVEAGDLLAEIA
jgi:acetyl-CoA carboxylase biotin carboxyl carrier protein